MATEHKIFRNFHDTATLRVLCTPGLYLYRPYHRDLFKFSFIIEIVFFFEWNCYKYKKRLLQISFRMLKIHWSRMPLPNLYTFILYTVGTYTAVPLLFFKGFLVIWFFSSVADPSSKYIEFGSGSRILPQFGSGSRILPQFGSGSRVIQSILKKEKNSK